ncbi:hypothetical protein [Marinoscillum sp. MHG1-6]|uniref:hypothetical protein n=1 Tax=Marinoscillum sp. MHG1-6 TaxID=2959627 RepID=UPI0021580077|nr:hypothetical protein [Marinoscillum sp. MHG1-6]
MKLNSRSLLNFIAIGSLSGALLSCGGSTKTESSSEVEFDEEQQITTDISKVIGDLPSPSEVPYTMQAIGADFDKSLINDLTKIEHYSAKEDEAALNLGVYATDIGYLSSYKKGADAMEYMQKCHDLAEALGIATVFNVATMEKFQESMGSPEEFNKVLNDAILEAEERLETSDRASIAGLVLTGSFVEGLYLATKVIETYPEDVLDDQTRNLILEPLVRVVLDQKKPLLDIIGLLNDLPRTEIITHMISEMNILKILYNDDLAVIEEKIKANTGNFVITQDMLYDVTEEVKRIRKDIVEL